MTSPLGPGPLVYAHRGARAYARDNTIEAFRLAIEQGAHGIELDAQLTHDGQVIVYHDDHHPEAGWLAQCHSSEVRRADRSIPTLDEAFTAIGAPCFINLELKNGRHGPAHDRLRRLASAVLPIIGRHDVAGRLLISSFDALMLAKVRRYLPEVPTGQLLSATDPRAAITWAAAAGHASVNVSRVWLADDAPGVVAEAEALGLAVCAWTVNDPDEVRAFADAGVAVIISDDPPMALRALGAP